MNKFLEWVKKNDKKQRGIAEKIGVSTSTLHDILRNDLIPSLKVAYQIEIYTNGAITLYDWVDQREEKTHKLSKSKTQTKEKETKK